MCFFLSLLKSKCLSTSLHYLFYLSSVVMIITYLQEGIFRLCRSACASASLALAKLMVKRCMIVTRLSCMYVYSVKLHACISGSLQYFFIACYTNYACMMVTIACMHDTCASLSFLVQEKKFSTIC